MNIKRIISIDVIDDILIRPDALDTYLGEEVKSFLDEKLTSIQEPTLFKLSIIKANPIDYLFTRAAFCNFFKTISQNEKLDAIFYLRTSQVKSLFWGLLACMDGNIDRTGDYESDFISSNCSIKLCLNDADIQFKSKLSEHESDILNFVNYSTQIEENDIYDQFKQVISNEKITDAIRMLIGKKFIYRDEDSMPNIIFSITSKFK